MTTARSLACQRTLTRQRRRQHCLPLPAFLPSSYARAQQTSSLILLVACAWRLFHFRAATRVGRRATLPASSSLRKVEDRFANGSRDAQPSGFTDRKSTRLNS